MITYVINTSENKTFDTEKLFSLVGYTKIVWMNVSLDEIEKCTEKIYDRQNVLGADQFRIAIIVDFYNFKHIKLPYAETGFSRDLEEKGVHISLYYPFIECYIIDHLFDKLASKNIFPVQRDIFYVQNIGCEPLEHIANEYQQLSNVLEQFDEDKNFTENLREKLVHEYELKIREELENTVGYVLGGKKDNDKKVALSSIDKILMDNFGCPTPIDNEDNNNDSNSDEINNNVVSTELEENKSQFDEKLQNNELSDENQDKSKEVSKNKRKGKNDSEKNKDQKQNVDYEKLIEEELSKYKETIDLPSRYRSFKLDCTDTLALTFSTSDYPYKGDEPLTMEEFYDAICDREKKIKTQYYYSINPGTTIMAAYDTLNLSLYLINIYEQEDDVDLDKTEVKKMNPNKLKEVLIRSWNKICIAQEKAKENQIEYFDIEKIAEDKLKLSSLDENIINNKNYIRSDLHISRKSEKEKKLDNIEEIYKLILEYAAHPKIGMSEKDHALLKSIVTNYMVRRDNDREQNIFVEFEEYKRDKTIKKTKKCPPMVVYEKIIADIESDISNIFSNTLKAEYISNDYTNEIKTAQTLMVKYNKLKNFNKGNSVGTIIFNVLVCLILIVPYALLQRTVAGIFNFPSIILYLIHLGFFGGVLFLSFFIQKLIINFKLHRLKCKMEVCLSKCERKNNESMMKFIQRYQEELPRIEEARYLIREVKKFREFNDQKEKHIKIHRNELENLENHLSSILNNLGIEAEVDDSINIDSEFNLEERINSPQNKVYKIFDLETIEYLFSKDKEDK